MDKLAFAIRGSLGEEAPDGFTVTLRTDRIGVSVYLTPDEFRQVWHKGGEVLREFDERAGEPSSADDD